MSDIINIRFEQYKPPTFKEAKSGSIILYGDKPGNPYPDYLINLYEQSTNHKAVVDAKVRYTTGGGWTVDTLRMPLAEEAVYIDKLKHINESGESLDDLTEKISLDFQIFNAFAIEVIYNKAKTKWAALNYVPISRIRAYKTDSGDIKYVHLTDWRNVSKYEQAKTFGETRGFKEWYAFGSRKNPADSELLYFRGFRPIKSGEVDVYAIPFYSGAIPWIELDIRTGIFHLNNIRNNFTAGAVLNFFNGDPTPEQKEEMERQIKAKFTGDNAEDTGGIMLVFNKPGTTGVTVERLQAGDMDKLYLQVAEFARQGIMTAHNINPILAGINTPGALGQRNEAEFMFEMFNSTYIQPIQEMVFERVINDLMQFNGLKPMFKLKDVKPFGMVFTEAFIEANLPADIKTKLAADYVGVDINVERQKLAFNSERDPFDELEGEDPNNYEILASFDIEYDENGYPVKDDNDFKNMYFAKVVEGKLGKEEADIIGIIKKNPKVTPIEIAEALKKDLSVIEDKLETLKELKIIIGETGKLEVSKLGENTIKEQDLEVEIITKYRYVEIDGIPKPLTKSRTWCTNRMNQLYTREQIDRIPVSKDARGNGSPWIYRGGYYRNPETGELTDYCRHKWEAVAVRLK